LAAALAVSTGLALRFASCVAGSEACELAAAALADFAGARGVAEVAGAGPALLLSSHPAAPPPQSASSKIAPAPMVRWIRIGEALRAPASGDFAQTLRERSIRMDSSLRARG